MPPDDLAEFLRSRRAAVEPGQVGLPAGGRRRAPGLRREEVSLLAGVSVTWYTWLEQGRATGVSAQVLDALARALLLDEAEHAHLRALAEPALAADGPEAGPPPDALVRLLDTFDPQPAYLLGPRWEYLAWNAAQGRLYPAAADLPEADRNLLRIVFTDPHARRLIGDWAVEAHRMVRQFRADTAAIRADPAVAALVAELTGASPEFAAWWSAHDVAGVQSRLRRYHHPVAGDLVFEYLQLTPPEWPHLRAVVQLAVPDDDSAARLAATGAPTEAG